MKGFLIRTAAVLGFAAAVGHLAWHTLVGPPVVPKYSVDSQGTVLSGPDPRDRQLYLRRQFHLSQPPRHAWIQVLGHDRLQVYVNGRLLAQQTLDGFPVAVVADLTDQLQVGPNVIGIVARQSSIDQPPQVAVDGAYLLSDGEHLLRADDAWKCSGALERGAAWWFEPAFDDRRWASPRRTEGCLHATVEAPPRAVTVPSAAHWITPEGQEGGSAGVRRSFDVADRPRQAWLRVTAPCSYRLAVNGILVDEQEDQLSTTTRVPGVRRTYDLTTLVRQGHNDLALALTATTGPARLLADLEVEDQAGQRTYVGTDGQWLGCSSLPAGLLQLTPGDATAWRPCRMEAGDLDMPPSEVRRKTLVLSLPVWVAVARGLGQAACIGVVFLLTWLACRTAAHRLAASQAGGDRPLSGTVVYLALVPVTLALGCALLACYDPRVPCQRVYQGRWLFLAIAAVPCQWGLLALAGVLSRPRPGSTAPLALRPRMVLVLLAALVAVGFWLRVRGIETEPLHWDEAEIYRNTRGLFQRGFPSVDLGPNAPPAYIHTSELLFASTGLAALVFDDARHVVRVPAVCFGTLMIGLIYLVGRRLISVPVGLLAAAVYTFSPVAIAMTNFGRYFCQLQFFTVLTVYFFWLTIRFTGQINRRALWWTAACFVCMFLTWEASALIVPAMVLAALWQFRSRLCAVLADPSVWLAMLLVALVVVLQQSHVYWQQSQFLWYGISLSDVTLKPMWRYVVFQPWYYVWESSWNQDTLIPLLGLLGAALLAVRHAARRPLRFLLLIYVGTCMCMVLLLPNIQWRYIFQMTPFLIVLASTAFVALARALMKLAGPADTPRPWQLYARAVGYLTVLTALAVGSGLTLQLSELPRQRIEGYGRLGTFKFPNLAGPSRFLLDHIREGDVVLGSDLQHLHNLMGFPDRPDRPSDYWLATRLFLPAMLSDDTSLPRDRRYGSVMIPSRAALEDLFARHRRIWYVVQPGLHASQNTNDVSAFLRQHMEVVYEDWQSLVLYRGEHHRTALQRQRDDQELQAAGANFLP